MRFLSRCTITLVCACHIFWLAACSATQNAPAVTPTSVTTSTAQMSPTATARTLSTPIVTYTGHSLPVYTLAWSPDGKYIASSNAHVDYADKGNDNVQIWDATSGKALLLYTGHFSQVYGLAWSPDGKLIASASYDKTVQIWNPATGQTLVTYTGHTSAVRAVVWSPDSTLLASASEDSTVQVWKAT